MKGILLKIITLFSVVFLVACQGGYSASNDINHYYAGGQGRTFALQKDNDIVGRSTAVKVRPGDTLAKIGAHYDVGVQEMIDANPHQNPMQLTVGSKIYVPSQYILPPKQYREGIVINVAELRLYYFSPDGRTVSTYPVALGRESWRTPTGNTKVVRKERHPTWNVPKSIRDHLYETQGELLPARVPPGPDNPLGDYAIYLGMSGYLIHGTNKPESIGQLVSSGCIRMQNADVAKLYAAVQPGTRVAIIHRPNKAGWSNNKLYVESHHELSDDTGNYSRDALSVRDAIQEASDGRTINVDNDSISRIKVTHTGNPIAVGG